MSSPELSNAIPVDAALAAAAGEIAAKLNAAVDCGQTIDDVALQHLMSAVTRLYAAKAGSGDHVRAFPEGGGGVCTTDVMLTTTAMLHGVNVQLFELGMWQAWTGAHALYRGEKLPADEAQA
jgi:hypothetical protein